MYIHMRDTISQLHQVYYKSSALCGVQKKKNIFYLPIDFIFNSNENFTVDYRYFKQCYLWHIIYSSSITRVNLSIGFSYFHPTGNDTVNTGKSALALHYIAHQHDFKWGKLSLT